jgi:hypothetical protein
MTPTTLDQKQSNYNMFISTIKSLAHSQGFYGRLLEQLQDLDAINKAMLINNLPMFNQPIDVIMYIEQ